MRDYFVRNSCRGIVAAGSGEALFLTYSASATQPE